MLICILAVSILKSQTRLKPKRKPTLGSEINVGSGINVGVGKFGKNNKRRVWNKRRVGNFEEII